MKTLITVLLLLAAFGAKADQTINCSTIATQTTCNSSSDDYSYLRNAGKADFARAGANLGQIFAARSNNRPVSLVLAVKCGNHATLAVVTYSDGSIKQVPMDMPVTDDDRTLIAATLPTVRIIDLAGCDQ